MEGSRETGSFGQKLNWLKSTFGGTDGEIGAAVGASDSLVCRWRNGQRSLDRIRDADLLNGLAGFFLDRAGHIGKTQALANALGVDDSLTESEAYCSAFVCFLYDGRQTPRDEAAVASPALMTAQVRQECYFGKDGLIDALSLLEHRMLSAPAEITVYLSLEHSRVVREESADKLWDKLWRMSEKKPVKLVFDNWSDAGEAMKTLRWLLPFVHTGRLRLNLIKSMQKFFYSNITFYAGEAGIIVTAEPAGGYGSSVSMLVESPEYIKGMGSVFARFDKNTKPLEKHLNTAATRDEAFYYGQLHEPGSDLKTIVDGVNLLYMDAGAYMKLLKLNGVTGSQRAYRLERFVSDKRRFEVFLETGCATEVFSLLSIDRIIASKELITPDLSFIQGKGKTSSEIIKSLIEGMLDYLDRYVDLHIFLNRRGLPYDGHSCRLKGDSFALLHSYGGNRPHAVWTDTWLLVYEYIRQFDEALSDADLITTGDAVKSAFKIRLQKVNS